MILALVLSSCARPAPFEVFSRPLFQIVGRQSVPCPPDLSDGSMEELQIVGGELRRGTFADVQRGTRAAVTAGGAVDPWWAGDADET